MPNYPKKLDNKYNSKYKTKAPFAMSSEDAENYSQYMFAKQQYEELVNFLNNKNDEIDKETKEPKGYGKNSFGFEKELDETMLALLKEKTENLLVSSKNFIDHLHTDENTIAGVHSLLYTARLDYESSVRINTTLETTEPDTLSYLAVYNNSTVPTIDLGETNVDTVGASLSSRLAIRYADEKGNLQKGFFTRDTETGHHLDLSKLKSEFPQLETVFSEIEQNERDYGIDETTRTIYIQSLPGNGITFRDVLIACGVKEETVDAVDFSNITPENEEKVKETIDDFCGLKNIDLEMGIKAGNNLNQRNTLMSDMAELIGRPNLLAKSKPMTIIENGEAVHGNFMENAKGVDYSDITPESSLFDGGRFTVNYEKIMIDVTDMMILDYICLNGDRHQNNMFYQFSKNENGDVTLEGIQGIDNDLSFGDLVPENSESVKLIPPLEDLQYITENTKNMVLSLTESKINAVLMGKGLSDNEVKACWQRTQKLQQLLNDPNSGIQIIGDESYDSQTAENQFNSVVNFFDNRPNLCTPANNIKLMMDTFADNLDELQQRRTAHIDSRYQHVMKTKNLSQNEAKAELRTEFNNQMKAQYTESEKKERIKQGLKGLQQKVYIDSKSTIKIQSKQIGKLVGKLWKPKKKDISQYTEMYNILHDLKDTLQLYKADKKMTDDMKQNLLAEKFKSAEQAIQNYQNKISKSPTRNDKKRIAITESIKGIAIDNRNSRERQVNEINTMMAQQVKLLSELNKKAETLSGEMPDSMDCKLAKMELSASAKLSAYLGNVELPKGAAKADADLDLTRLCLVGKLQQMKSENPETYDLHVKKLSEQPNTYLDQLTQELYENKDFKKILDNVNPANALRLSTANKMLKVANDIGVFNTLEKKPEIVEKQANPSVKGSTKKTLEKKASPSVSV